MDKIVLLFGVLFVIQNILDLSECHENTISLNDYELNRYYGKVALRFYEDEGTRNFTLIGLIGGHRNPQYPERTILKSLVLDSHGEKTRTLACEILFIKNRQKQTEELYDGHCKEFKLDDKGGYCLHGYDCPQIYNKLWNYNEHKEFLTARLCENYYDLPKYSCPISQSLLKVIENGSHEMPKEMVDRAKPLLTYKFSPYPQELRFFHVFGGEVNIQKIGMGLPLKYPLQKYLAILKYNYDNLPMICELYVGKNSPSPICHYISIPKYGLRSYCIELKYCRALLDHPNPEYVEAQRCNDRNQQPVKVECPFVYK